MEIHFPTRLKIVVIIPRYHDITFPTHPFDVILRTIQGIQQRSLAVMHALITRETSNENSNGSDSNLRLWRPPQFYSHFTDTANTIPRARNRNTAHFCRVLPIGISNEILLIIKPRFRNGSERWWEKFNSKNRKEFFFGKYPTHEINSSIKRRILISISLLVS